MAYIGIAHKSNTTPFQTDVLWQCSRDAAIAVCSDERTKGTGHFLMWFEDEPQRIKWVRDNGMYDDVLADIGLEAKGRELVEREPVQLGMELEG